MDGVLSLAQARSLLSDKAIRHRVDSGRWRRLHRTVLVTHNGPVSPAQLRRAAVLAAGDGAAIAGLSAVSLRGHPASAIDVLIPADRQIRHRLDGVTLHRSTLLGGADVRWDARPPRTRTARSLVDAAQWARSESIAQAIIAAGFQQRLVREGDMRAVLDRMTRVRRRRLILHTVDDAAGGAHSLAEIDFVALCRRHRLPRPSLQAVRCDAGGRRRYLDAQFARWRVVVEVDGGHHMDVRKPGPTWHARTTSGSRASECSASQPGQSAPIRHASPPNYA